MNTVTHIAKTTLSRLVAQAIPENFTLLSNETIFSRYGAALPG